MKIEIDIPDHLAEPFLSWMSNSGEQEFMEVASETWDPETMEYTQNPNYIIFDYPGWKDKIVVREEPKE
ncbi:hypothetical protein MYO4S_00254 [Serratia phage 4S]|nr:hypothetical protein MYO4S_00254 [Serratia phage 4S]